MAYKHEYKRTPMQLFVITADDRRGGAIHVRLHASALSPPPPYSQQYHVRLTLHHVRQVADGASVAVLRETLAEREGIPACEMCLMANGRQLAEDRRRVEDRNITTVHKALHLLEDREAVLGSVRDEDIE